MGGRSIQYDLKEGQLMGTSLYSNGEVFLVCLARHDFRPSYIVGTISTHTSSMRIYRSVVRAQRVEHPLILLFAIIASADSAD